MGLILPIDLDEESGKIHLSFNQKTFDCIQHMFFVYPEKRVRKHFVKFRNEFLLEDATKLELTIREFEVFCEGVLNWAMNMDHWPWNDLEKPFGDKFDRDTFEAIERDVAAIRAVIRPKLMSGKSVYSE